MNERRNPSLIDFTRRLPVLKCLGLLLSACGAAVLFCTSGSVPFLAAAFLALLLTSTALSLSRPARTIVVSHWRTACSVIAALIVCGVLCLVSPNAPVVLVCCGGFCEGVSLAVLGIAWLSSHAQTRGRFEKWALLSLCISVCAGLLVAWLCLFIAPSLRYVIMGFALMVSDVALLFSSKRLSAEVQADDPAATDRQPRVYLTLRILTASLLEGGLFLLSQQAGFVQFFILGSFVGAAIMLAFNTRILGIAPFDVIEPMAFFVTEAIAIVALFFSYPLGLLVAAAAAALMAYTVMYFFAVILKANIFALDKFAHLATGTRRCIVGLVIGTLLSSLLVAVFERSTAMTIFCFIAIALLALNYLFEHMQRNVWDVLSESGAESDKVPASESALSFLAPFNAACDAVATAYAFTPREREVFALLARGRNAGAIAQILDSSIGTVRTHTSHIYFKLEVNSQQELIFLVEKHLQ